MIALDQPALVDITVRVEQVTHRLRQRALAAKFLGITTVDAKAIQCRAAEHVEDQHAVVRRDGAAGFADDQRMRDVAGVTDAADAIHHIAGVLVQGVVHRRREVCAAAIVVDAKAAADVDVLEPGAHELEFRVHVGELVDRVLDAADVL